MKQDKSMRAKGFKSAMRRPVLIKDVRVKEALGYATMAELARIVGVDWITVHRWTKGRVPRGEAVKRNLEEFLVKAKAGFVV